MKELKDVLVIVADALKSFAEGMKTIAGEVDALAQSNNATEMEPDEPKPNTPDSTKTEKAKPVTKVTVKKPAVKTTVKAVHEKKEVVKPPVKKKTVLRPAPENKEVVKKPVVKITRKSVPETTEVGTASDTVLQLISDATNGIDTGAIVEKTGFDKKKVFNIVHRLKKNGKIESAGRGIYTKKG